MNWHGVAWMSGDVTPSTAAHCDVCVVPDDPAEKDGEVFVHLPYLVTQKVWQLGSLFLHQGTGAGEVYAWRYSPRVEPAPLPDREPTNAS